MFLFQAGKNLRNLREYDLSKDQQMIYFAAAALPGRQGENLCRAEYMLGLRNRLLSYFDTEGVPGAFEFWLSPAEPGKRLFIDSGAFSAYTQGIPVDLGAYIKWLHAHKANVYCYACLDIINDCEGTRRNYETMVAAGLKPIPVFHVGSPLEELERYCGLTDFVALGGSVQLSKRRELLQRWFDSCFAIVKKFWPVKVHAFGVTAQWLLERYPFFSCDSSGAIVGGGLGRVLDFKGGQVDRRPLARTRQGGKANRDD